MKRFFREYMRGTKVNPWAFQATYYLWHQEIVGIATEPAIDSFRPLEVDPNQSAPDFSPAFMCDQVYWYSNYLRTGKK